MTTTGQMHGNELMAQTVDFPHLPIDGAVTKNSRAGKRLIATQQCMNRVSYGFIYPGCQFADFTAYVIEIIFQTFFVMRHDLPAHLMY